MAGTGRRWGSAAVWTLRDLSERTGGAAYVGRNDLENMMREAIETPRITYTLGFYLPDEERDDKFHPLQVHVNRAKVTLSYRQGYFAGSPPAVTAPKKREQLESAVLDPQDSADVAITAEVIAVKKATRPVVRVGMRLGLGQLSLQQKSGDWAGKIEEMFLEMDGAGQQVARIKDTKEFKISERLRREFERDGLPLRQEIGLMENAVRLLIVVRDAESGRTGSLSVPLDEMAGSEPVTRPVR